ncbi:MAG: alanine racemase [Spirochaetes bacterium]|nr:alanine racemase [Spirochaetota bacterium]
MFITKPTLLVDTARVRRNIKRIAGKALISGVVFRPHFKTHQSSGIGEFFKEEGVASIAVSSMDMALYFADSGWKDITVAFPVNIRQIDVINSLAGRINLHLLVESEQTVNFLKNNLLYPVDLWIEIDVGHRRTGIDCSDGEAVAKLAGLIRSSRKFKFSGLLTHAGNTYRASGNEEIKEIYRDMVDKLYKLKENLRRNGVSDIALSIGDTPTAGIVADFSEVDEIRPGNFVFYDVMQYLLGICKEEDIAVAVACPVVAKYGGRGEVVVYGGAVHLSKERASLKNGTVIYGLVSLADGDTMEDGWGKVLRNSYVRAVSQEHGVIKIAEEYFDKIKIGDLLYILPVHSCLTVNLMGGCLSLSGRYFKVMGHG